MINKTILNLKKLKSFHIHNGNYDPDIDRAIKALEQQSNMVSRSAYEQVMWERDVVIDQLKELGYGFGEKPKTGHWTAVENEEMETIGYYCSECDLPMETENQTRFCPNCGAKMSEIQAGLEKGGDE